jgi:DNA repair protein SbcC/Rad50
VKIESIEISGLRSHRGNPPTSLDLSNKRLVAVVGHTGAGKSSLLEAMTFAVFGEATYGGRAYEELSTDGRSEMTVQLVFTIGDERYQILRTVRPDRNGKFGNKVVYLRRVDEKGNTLMHREGYRDVEAAVTALLGGMTREQFCQAVLLAQNRFAALLEANPAQREALLDTLLGLNALHEARTALQKTRSAVLRNVTRLLERRSYLPDDPRSEAREAKARAESMKSIASKAEECGSRLDELVGEATGLAEQADELERAAALRTTPTGPSGLDWLAGIVSELAVLSELDDTLTAEEQTAAKDLEQSRDDLGRATEAQTMAEAQHGPAGRHPLVAQQLENLSRLLAEGPGLEDAVTTSQDYEKRLQAELSEVQGKAGEAKEMWDQVRQGHIQAETGAVKAAAAAELAEKAVDSVTAVVQRLVAQVGSAERAKGELDLAQTQAEQTEGALEPLAAAQTEASEALEEATRARSASAAAHGCHPGDDCPVCGRSLPDSWIEPVAVDLDEARQLVAETKKTFEAAATRNRSAREASSGARARLRSALEGVASTYAELKSVAAEQGLEAPASDLGLPQIDESDAALDVAIDLSVRLPDALGEWTERLRVGLGPLQQTRQEPASATQKVAERLEIVEAQKAKAQGLVTGCTADLAAAKSELAAALGALESSKARLAGTLSSIDERWRVIVDPGQMASLEDARRTLDSDQKEVEDAVRAHELADERVRDLERVVQKLDGRRSRELTVPLAGAQAALATLTDLVNDLSGRLDLARAPQADKVASAPALHGAASKLETVARHAVDQARTRSTELRLQVSEFSTPATDIVSELVGLMTAADPEGTAFEKALDPSDPLSNTTRQLVQQIIGGAMRLAVEASQRADDAEEAALSAKEIDGRVERLQSWVADLDGGIEVLKKERFPRWAREIKMADLVETASDHLSEMTDSRFRFDPSLQISDEVAGVVRKASTLSGGEKFEASLALALGVSEIAGRSGVRIETLFLDEGFAGLDQAHLNRALDALEREVAAGRNILLITHIGSVADRIQDVLLIQPDGFGGSTVKWLDEDERFELGADLDLAVP